MTEAFAFFLGAVIGVCGSVLVIIFILVNNGNRHD